MIRKVKIENLDCLCCRADDKGKIAYILYPMDILSGWIETAAKKYGTDIIVITGMDWQNVETYVYDETNRVAVKGSAERKPGFRGRISGIS